MSSSKKIESNVDVNDAQRNVWLVKVPRYLSDIWRQNHGQFVGELDVWTDPQGRTQCRLTNQAKFKQEDGNSEANAKKNENTLHDPDIIPLKKPRYTSLFQPSAIPVEHKFEIRSVKDQTMFLLNEDKSHLAENKNLYSGKLSIQGKIAKRAEIQPPPNKVYMNMKIHQIKETAIPKRTAILLNDDYKEKLKPLAKHEFMVNRDKVKKEKGKAYRMEKETLQTEIFKCFELHQFYFLKDLAKKLDQPQSYVHEVLNEIAEHISQPPHKGMWQLKPEYRSYGDE